MDDFENLKVTLSPGKKNRKVDNLVQEEKRIAGEVLLGTFSFLCVLTSHATFHQIVDSLMIDE